MPVDVLHHLIALVFALVWILVGQIMFRSHRPVPPEQMVGQTPFHL